MKPPTATPDRGPRRHSDVDDPAATPRDAEIHTTPRFRDAVASGTIHFIGIGGAGMLALAEAVVRHGGRVTGCDLAAGGTARAIERMGVRIHDRHESSHVADVAGVVVSAAISEDQPELSAARASGVPVWKRAAALGEWVDEGDVVAVSGTHGKTTTTAMVTEILARAGRDPTGFVGGWMPSWKSHLRPGSDDLYIVEADEYDRSFHRLRPSIAVVNNVDADHLDVYGDFDGVREGFARFLAGVREDGCVIACSDDPSASSLLAALPVRTRTFGFAAGSQIRGVDLERTSRGTRFRVVEDGTDRGPVEVSVAGRHNASNALAAIAVSRELDIGWDAIRGALEDFSGVGRRFQKLGSAAGVVVVDDYAHHPREVDAALDAARLAYPAARLVAVFQPHLYTRTRDFQVEFGRSLSHADMVWITDVYPAREERIPNVDGDLVAKATESAGASIPEGGAEVRYHADLDSLADRLSESLRPGDLCLTLGAGSIERIGPEVLGRLKDRERHQEEVGRSA